MDASLSCAPAVAAPETSAGLAAALADLPAPRARRGVRRPLVVVVTAAVCAVAAGYRPYTAIAEWVADVPAATALALGIAPDRRPSDTMIRRLLPALDPDQLTQAVGAWLAVRSATAPSPARRATAVDGKTLCGPRTADTTARHVLAACDQSTSHGSPRDRRGLPFP
ncbi:transposase family protein [Micromonospora peucetia]|uniref:transposase family protein n=1 Tax=Micromonospora peucetia TaxID=47871 RepID=UPI002DDA1A40|nr:transposase family protein [Micromonospora peucetia]